MSIVNGDPVSESGTNPRLASKLVDNILQGIQSLQATGSGANVTNLQRLLNNIIAATGMFDENATGLVQSSVNFIVNGDSANASLDNLDAQLKSTDDNLNTHTSSAGNVHGIGIGSDVVGTETGQTLQNKTITNTNNTLRVVTGTRAAPIAITAVGGITPAPSVWDQTYYVEGSGGPVDITAVPQIVAGTKVGQRLFIIGRSDTNTLQLDDGDGLDLNGICELGLNQSILLEWDGVNWYEVNRRA